MPVDKIIVQKGKEKRIVQRSMIPRGFYYVEDYKEPKKTATKPKTEEK